MNIPHRLTDKELDSALSARDAQLLDHVRAHANPASTLVALLDLNVDLNPAVPSAPHRPPDPSTTHVLPSLDNPRTPARVIASRMRVLDVALDLARALVLALGIDRSRALDIDLDIDRTLARARDTACTLDSDLALDLALDLDLALARARDTACTLDLDLDHALGLDHAQKIARVLALNIDLNLVQEVARVITRARDLALDIDRALSDVPVDASGADLSDLKLGEDLREYPHVLVGVVWNRDTRWPPGMHVWIMRLSEEIKPGVWRVRSGTERDRHEASRV
jgi:hypothetical protein